jgi:uncharacterized protein
MIQLKASVFARMNRFSFVHHRLIFWVTLILLAGGLFLISRLKIQSDVAHLLPENAPTTQAFRKFYENFGTADSLFIALERKTGGTVEIFEPFAETMAELLLRSGEFREIQGRLDPSALEKIKDLFIGKALLFLDEQDLKKIENRLEKESLQRQVRSLKTRLHSPLGSYTSQWAASDPLHLWPFFQKHFPADPTGMETAGMIYSGDRKMMLLIAKPKGAAPDIRYDELLWQTVKDAEIEARGNFLRNKKMTADDLGDLTIGLAGGYINALEDSRLIKKDLVLNFSISLGGVLTIFFLAFRRKMAIFYALFPLLASPLLTLGFLAAFLGRLSESTGAFAAIILGLSVDFIILLYNRYLEERNNGRSISDAMEQSMRQTGPGVFTGGVTTAAAYLALLYSDFQGMRELGLLTGTGILFSLLCAFFLFPALLAWREKEKSKDKSLRPPSAFGLENLISLALPRPFLIIFLIAVVSILTGVWAFQVKVSNDPKKLRPADLSSLGLEARIQEKMGEGLESIVFLAEAESVEESLELQGQLQKKFQAAMASGLPMIRLETLAAFLPPFSQQNRNLQWIRERSQSVFHPGRVEEQLRKTLRDEGLRVESFKPGLEILKAMLTNRERLTWEDFQRSPLKDIGEKFLKCRENICTSAAYLQVGPGFWTHPKARAFLQEMEEMAPGIRVTGSKLIQEEWEQLMAHESWKVLLIALAAVFILIYFDFRSFRLTLLGLLPVVLASIWTLGLMGMMGMNLNFMNIIVFTMALGVGVDYGVHILHRWREPEGVHRVTGLLQVSKGVVLAALTTLVGFGSLVSSGFPGLQSMGAVALMGVGFSALLALTLVPALLKVSLPKSKE